jgi:predicted CopG family antitoxin
MGATKGKTKSIIVNEENHQRLTEMGKKSESFNDIISRILDRLEVIDQNHRNPMGDAAWAALGEEVGERSG